MTARYSRRALRQLDGIFQYISSENPRAAASVKARIETLVSLLARHPAIGRQTTLEGVRVFLASPYPYLVFYRIDDDEHGITVLRVRHTSRKEDWRKGH
jgi:addiction module RelE/StbE family toxin